ncbi:MAG: class I SAM-dependent methyltransferase [candidate division WWE3 bacterium]|nr:class I SAM-dependent methyltransferase [candidate division WWE3 bacterium]
MNFLQEFLKIAPYSLAVWRAGEAEAINQAYADFKPQGKILDIGCGFGEFMSVFSKVINGNKIDLGVDICQSDINEALKKNVYEKIICCDARDLHQIKDKYNTVLAVSVLEHISNVEKVFDQVQTVLNPGGYCIFTVPTNKLNSKLWTKLLHKTFKHVSLLSKEEWIKISENSGLTIRQVKGTISQKELTAFESGLITALVTQPSRWLFKKRLLISPEARLKTFEKVAVAAVADEKMESNILVVAQKI